MSILSVDNISPIGSGTSVTVNSAATLVLTNANSTGVITATSFVGSGANLTSLPAQATIANNADNRVITGGSGVNLNGEANLTYNGSILHNQISAGARNDFSTSADGLIIEKGGNTGLSIDPGSSGVANIYFPNESNHSIASISHNNSNGELRVRGEDHIILSTNNNTERLRIDSNGKLLKGHTADVGQIRTQFNQDNQFVGDHNAGIRIASYANDAYCSSLEFVKSRSATLGTNTLIQNGDTLGQIFWGAADGSNYQPAAYINAVIDGAPNTNDVPTRLSFGTAKDGANGANEKMRINPAGQIMIGDYTVGNSTTEKLILQGQIGNDNFESSIALRRGTTISTADAGLGYIKFQDSAGSTGALLGGRADNTWSGSSRPTHLWFATVNSGSTSPTERLRITSGGYLQQHKLIAVSYSDTRAISLTDADLTTSNFYNHTNFASDSSILDSNGHFVAPVHGIYRLYFRCTTDSNSGNRANVRLRKNGTTVTEAYASMGSSGFYLSVSSEIIMELNANEYMDIQVSQLHTQSGNQHKIVNFHMLG